MIIAVVSLVFIVHPTFAALGQIGLSLVNTYIKFTASFKVLGFNSYKGTEDVNKL